MATSKARSNLTFIGKINPDATVRSVVRQATVSAVVAAGVWGLSQYFRTESKVPPTLSMFLFWIGCAAVVGAVWEWQAPKRPKQIDE